MEDITVTRPLVVQALEVMHHPLGAAREQGGHARTIIDGLVAALTRGTTYYDFATRKLLAIEKVCVKHSR